MKKTLSIIVIFIILSSNVFASEYKLTSSDKIIINKLSSKIQKLLDKNDLNFRFILDYKIFELKEQFKKNVKLYSIFEGIQKNTNLYSYGGESRKHYNDYNIDFKKVKNTWLNWHNQAREQLGKQLYSYDNKNRLDSSAYEWSMIQQKRKTMTHERNFGDGFYNYPVIEKWFNQRGIRCKVAGGATSSESIGKFGYYCKDNDCTDELIKSLKGIFDLYMSEKGLSYPANAHYKAITHASITKIGLGLSIVEDKNDGYSNYKSYNYYVTTHYCTEFKN